MCDLHRSNIWVRFQSDNTDSSYQKKKANEIHKKGMNLICRVLSAALYVIHLFFSSFFLMLRFLHFVLADEKPD